MNIYCVEPKFLQDSVEANLIVRQTDVILFKCGNDLCGTDTTIQLPFFVGIGFLLAAVVFVISAVAIPLILDKDADFVTAMQTSYRAVTCNPRAMAVWAMSIVTLTAVGIATAFVGFAVIFPVLGYATWHSYRALVK